MCTSHPLTDLERAFLHAENPAQWRKRADTVIVTLPKNVWANTCRRYRAVRHGVTVWGHEVKVSAVLDIGGEELAVIECALPLDDSANMHLAWSPK